MTHPNVVHAFETLLEELNSALMSVREDAAAATNKGEYDKAQALLNEARQLERFMQRVQALQREWVDRGENLSRRRAPATGRIPRDGRTPQEAYRLPILRALVAMGGSGRVDDVLERVYEELRLHLKPADLEPVPSDARTPRWRNSAQWERMKMVNDGLLRSDSPRGIWVITEKGRQYLEQHWI